MLPVLHLIPTITAAQLEGIVSQGGMIRIEAGRRLAGFFDFNHVEREEEWH